MKRLVIKKHREIAALPFEETAGAQMSNDEVATSVRMLMRTTLNHEAVCVVARDRIVWLAGRVEQLELELEAMRAAMAQAEHA